MREILFRGKRLDNGEWVEGGLTKDMVCGEYEIIHQDFDGVFGYEEFYPVNPDTVGQYTGLKDKHGKRIFEGDIVRTKDGDIKKIIYKDYWGAFGAEYGLLFDKEFGKYVKAHGGVHFYGDSQFYEVIGNIHDNPELLEESK